MKWLDLKEKTFQECRDIIERSETIARICDDFLNQLKVFSEKQLDLMNIKPIGTMSTILVHDPIPDSEEQKKEQKTNKRSGNY